MAVKSYITLGLDIRNRKFRSDRKFRLQPEEQLRDHQDELVLHQVAETGFGFLSFDFSAGCEVTMLENTFVAP
jgi:hypothetical protein